MRVVSIDDGGMSFPPGPRMWALQQAIEYGTDPCGFLDRCRAQYGASFTLRFPGISNIVVVSEPELVKAAFAVPPDSMSASEVKIPLDLGDHSVLFLDGEEHRRERKLLMPPLHGEHLAGYIDIMLDMTDRALDEFVGEGPTVIAIQPVMQRITLDVIMTCVFGVAEPERADRLRTWLTDWLDGALSGTVFLAGLVLGAPNVKRFLTRQSERARHDQMRFPWIPWRKLGYAKAQVMKELERELENCRANPRHGRSDILAMLADTVEDDGKPYPIENAVDELITLLVGGHETTANSLCWAIHHLLDQPEATARLQDEVSSECEHSQRLSTERLRQMRFLEACMQESMRLTPIAPVIPRPLVKSYQIGEHELPAGTLVWVSPYLMHHHPDLWSDPRAFRPERFLEDGEGARARAHVFFPFGGGRRRCIGATFAQMEMRMIMARLYQRYDLTRAEDSNPMPMVKGITLAPKDGLRVVATARRSKTRSHRSSAGGIPVSG